MASMMMMMGYPVPLQPAQQPVRSVDPRPAAGARADRVPAVPAAESETIDFAAIFERLHQQ